MLTIHRRRKNACTGFYFCLYLTVLELEAAEADHVEYLSQPGDMARVVDGHWQLDEPEMTLSQPRENRFVRKNGEYTICIHILL
jgi:hypothetical protein